MKRQIIMSTQVMGLLDTSLLLISYCLSLQMPLTQNKWRLNFLFQQLIMYYHKYTAPKYVW